VVQADLALGLLEALLSRPPRPGHPDQAEQGGFGRAAAGGEGQLPGRSAAAHQQLPGHPAGSRRCQLDPRPVVQPAALGAVPGAAGHLAGGRRLLGRRPSGQDLGLAWRGRYFEAVVFATSH